jgi:predicted exporter
MFKMLTLIRATWLISIICCAGYIFYSLNSGIQFDTDILSLLPESPHSQSERVANQSLAESSNKRVIFLIAGSDKLKTKAAALQTQQVLLSSELFQKLQGQINAQQLVELQASLARFEYFHLTAADQQSLENLPASNEHPIIKQALSRLYSPLSAVVGKDIQSDPLQLFFNWQSSMTPLTAFSLQDDWLAREFDDQVYYLISAELQQSPFDIATQHQLEQLLSSLKQTLGDDIEVLTSGIIFHASHGAKQAQFEISTIGLGSILAIMVLLLLVFRKTSLVLLTFLPILVGCTVAFALTLLLFDKVHLITLAFGAGLIGVAIDYSLHFICAAIATQSKQGLLRSILPSLALGLLSSIVAYAAQAMTPFPGLRQMACFSALGLIAAWLTVVLFLPLFNIPTSDWVQKRILPTLIKLRKYWPNAQQPLFYIPLVIALMLALWQLNTLSINDDIKNLQTSPAELITKEVRVLNLLEAPAFSQYLVLNAETAEELLQLEEATATHIEKIIAKGYLQGFQSSAQQLYSQQKQHLQHQLITDKVYADQQLLHHFSQQLGAESIAASAQQVFLNSNNAIMTHQQWLQEPASQGYRHLWLGQSEDRYYSLITFSGLTSEAIEELIQLNSAQVVYIDRLQSISNILTLYRSQLLLWIVAAYGFILLVLAMKYRLQAWRIIAAPALASIFAIAFLSAVGAQITLFNLLALLIVLGIGLDASIFLFDSKGQPHTWLAVNLSTLTTLFAFGLLGLCQTPVLHYFGITILLGIFLIWLLAPSFTIKVDNNEAR